MTPVFDAAIAKAKRHGLKVGPVSMRPNDVWRAYVQKDDKIFRLAEAPAIDLAIAMAVDRGVEEMGGAKPSEPDMLA